jgi:hypothetical protein
MSTKTTFKRIALVAVAALGLGVVSTVAPASAATVYTAAISVTTDKAPVAGTTGTPVVHTVRFATATTGLVAIYPRAILTSKPAASTMVNRADSTAFTVPGFAELTSEATQNANTGSADMNVNGRTVTTAAVTGYTGTQGYAYLHAWYDVPGTYTWAIWDDATDATGSVNGLEASTVFTVVVGATGTTATYEATTKAYNTTSFATGTNGALVRIALTSAAAAAGPDIAGGVKVTVTGTGTIALVNNGSASGATTSYILGATHFNGSGYAWVNVTNVTAETITLTLSGVGSMASSFTAPSPVVLTFKAEIASLSATVINAGSATGLLQATANKATSAANGTATANKASTSAITFQTTKSDATAAALDAVTVTDGTGAPITGGASGYAYDILVASGDSTVCTTYCGTFSVTPVWTSTIVGQTFKVSDYASTLGTTVTSDTAAATTLSVSAPTAALRAVIGSSQSFTIKAVDQFGLVIANAPITGTIAGRNSTVNVASCITVAGLCSLTYADASVSTTSMIDTLTFANTTATSTTATVTYSTLAGLGVSTVLATTTNTSSTTGADLTTFVPFAVAAGSDGVEAGRKTVTITVKDANAVGIAGVPVTVSVAGTGAAIYSTTKTVYTNSLGVATSSVYAWLAPVYGTNYVVTATAGGVADTVNTYWGQADASHTRTFTATSVGRVITVIAKDRLGNPVSTASFTARITAGDGFFGTGTNVATGTTDATGMMKFVTLESPTDLTVVIKAGDSSIYAQTDAPAGNISSADPLDVFTAATAGTATTAETGVGDTFAPAGINTATVTILGAPSATEATSQAAVDAAAEATDAANAATDAANAAAEAADAATAAAQDAADAVAALSTQVSEMVTALKKQITALTNLVIKIQKKVKA